jgi:hypothetical protein
MVNALEAANRIMHEPRPHNEDEVQLVAGRVLELENRVARAEDVLREIVGAKIDAEAMSELAADYFEIMGDA